MVVVHQNEASKKYMCMLASTKDDEKLSKLGKRQTCKLHPQYLRLITDSSSIEYSIVQYFSLLFILARALMRYRSDARFLLSLRER